MLTVMRWSWLIGVLCAAGCERLVIPAAVDAGTPDAGVISPCLTFAVEEEYEVNGHTVTSVAPWEGDALVFTAPGPRIGSVAHRIGFGGMEALDLGLADMFVNGAHTSDEGVVWVGGGRDPDGSQIRSGRPPNVFAPFPPRPATGSWVRDVSTHGDTVFALTDSNSLDVHSGGQWRRRRIEPDDPWGHFGSIVALGDDEAVYLEWNAERVMRYAADRHTEELASITASFVGPVEAMGTLVVGRSDGRLFSRDGTTWSDLGASETLIVAIASVGDGVVFADRSGNVGQYHDGFGFCPAQPTIDVAPLFIQPIPGGLVLTLEQPAEIYVLRARQD
jgi:hypothetical protein